MTADDERRDQDESTPEKTPEAQEPEAREGQSEESEAPEPAEEQAPEPAGEEPPADDGPAEEQVLEVSDESAPEETAPEETAPEKTAPDESGPDEAPAREAPRRPTAKRGAKDEPDVIPGEHLEPDLVLEEEGEPAAAIEGLPPEEEAAAAAQAADPTAESEAPPGPREEARTPLDLAADARYHATGKRKSAVARVILRPGSGAYTINGRPLDDAFPRPTLQTVARQPLETAGYETRMDVVARIHGGGVSSQAGALRHGIARALVEADPNLRGELKRRGFLTRDARVKERKKAGLKKARKRPQFSKR